MARISKRRIWGWAMGVMIVAVLAAAEHPLYRAALVGAGYTAEMLCSGLFVSHRTEQDIVGQELSGPGYELLALFFHTVDLDKKRVTASIPGFAFQTAIFRDGLGCTLLNGQNEDELKAETAALFSTRITTTRSPTSRRCCSPSRIRRHSQLQRSSRILPVFIGTIRAEHRRSSPASCASPSHPRASIFASRMSACSVRLA
jgi:hypothetical protein